ncbi:MAG: hypothetical protein HY075_12125 [Deltaproteobacteria bacterium]|nr:hypothetical protein [Deltaproteobacteria bacterium]
MKTKKWAPLIAVLAFVVAAIGVLIFLPEDDAKPRHVPVVAAPSGMSGGSVDNDIIQPRSEDDEDDVEPYVDPPEDPEKKKDGEHSDPYSEEPKYPEPQYPEPSSD